MKMDMNLKVKQLITLPAFLLLAACAGDGAADDSISLSRSDSAGGSAIFFSIDENSSATNGRSATRAAGREDLSQLKTDGFGVFACRTGKHPYVSSSISWNFMWNQKVEYSGGSWTYSPIKYWPNETTDGTGDEYVTFFAYAPYSRRAEGSDKASNCIVDFSNNSETGDAWLTYQLGGSENAWQNDQVDLLYAVAKDQKRPETTGARIKFSFRHALAGAGDRVKVVCGELFQYRLRQLAAAAGADVTLTLNKVTLDYTLTRKGRLVLNNASEPNWQEIASDGPMVHRTLELTPSPAYLLATATSASCTAHDYEKSDLGVFYIPMNPAGEKQQVEVTVYYSLSTGYSGSVSGVIELAVDSADSRNQDYVLTLSSGTPLE